MKKSKFLLLGSVASLASIPFVAAKCGETKEEKKPRSGQTRSQVHQLTRIMKNPGQGKPANSDQGTKTRKRYTTDKDKKVPRKTWKPANSRKSLKLMIQK